MNVRACVLGGGFLAALFLLFGCSTRAKSPLEPSSSLDAKASLDGSSFGGFGNFVPRGGIEGNRFFPLDSGSVWIYTLDQRSILADSTPPDTILDHGSVTTRMLGTHDFIGTPYTLSTETTRIRDDREFELQIFYRQDATGLYELDPPIRDPLARARASHLHDALVARIAAGRPESRAARMRALDRLEARAERVERLLHAVGPVPSTGPQGQPEIQRLAYPLFVGSTWIVRADPLFTERVEAREVVAVGNRRLTAWRIRIESEFFGPDDRVWFWVSREGELRFRYRLVEESADDAGNPAGITVLEQVQQLVQYQLAGRLVVGEPVLPTPFGGRTTLREAPRDVATP